MDYEEYKKSVRENRNANAFARDSYSSFLSNDVIRESGYRPYRSPRAFNPNLDTTEGLYELSVRAGLKDGADRALERAGGENQKYMSGGFIMDTMDVLNTLQYGVTGLIKGQTFADGVKNRESFSDEDSLGKYGWSGKIAGLVLDIVVDPLTYIAPWKQIAKIPGVANNLESAKTLAFGELKVIPVNGAEIAQRVGGWTPLNYLSNKLVYGHAMDPKFLRGYESLLGQMENVQAEADTLIQTFAKIDPTVTKKTLEFDDMGYTVSKNLDDLKRELSNEDFEKIKGLYDARDSLMKALVDEGVLTKEAAERNWGTYLTQSYDEFILEKSKTKGFSKQGIALDYRARNQTLTKEERLALKPVEDAPVVWGMTLLKQVKELRNARLQNFVAKNFAFGDEDLAEFLAKGGDISILKKVPDSSNYKIMGKEMELKTELTRIRKELKGVRKARRKVEKDFKGLEKEIAALDRAIDAAQRGSEKELGEALSGLKTLFREGGLYDGARKKVPTSQGQKIVADKIKAFLNAGKKSERLAREQFSSEQLLKEFLDTDDGIALMRAFEDPRMMYQWRSMGEFFDAVRYPDKAKIAAEPLDDVAELTDEAGNKLIKRAEEKQRKAGEMTYARETLSETNLKLVREAADRIEDAYADLLFDKKNVLEALNKNKHAQLAGKYVTKEMWDMLSMTTAPTKEIGESVVMPFKKAKVIWNISSYPRNAMSAMVQNWWRLGMGPWNVGRYIDATKEMKQGGRFYNEMKGLGFSEKTGAIFELTQNYVNDRVMGEALARNYGMKGSAIRKKLKHVDRVLVNSYGHIDNIAKVAAYKYARQVKNLEPEDALKAAYEATYNYSQVTPFVHQMRRAIWGVPFITFNLKSVGLVSYTLKEAPNRISVFGKARNALFQAAGVEGEQEAEALPDWMRDDAFLLRLPWKDGDGRSMYFDLSYILPFGAIMTGEYLKDPIASNPALQLVRELSRNETFSGYKIFNESDDMEHVIADIFTHTAKLMLPPVVEQQLPRGYKSNGERVYGTLPRTFMEEDRGAGERSFYQEMFRLAGMNVTPFELEDRQRRMDWVRRENLQQLLVENDIISEFRSPYVPEESPINQPSQIFDRNVDPLGR